MSERTTRSRKRPAAKKTSRQTATKEATQAAPSLPLPEDGRRRVVIEGVHPEIEFMTLSSYGSGTQSSGEVKLNSDVSSDMTGKTVLIVDDILESGRTLHFATELLVNRGASAIKTAVLLEKPGKLEVKTKADFVGFSIPDKFVVGYGLDYANHYRELPFIGFMDVH